MDRMAAPTRRTQQERRAATRTALLAAAVACLTESGFAGFTTTEVTRRAGTSQGALFKHFPTKSGLLAATIEHVFDGLRSDFTAAYDAVPPGERTVTKAFDLLWRQMLDERLGAAYDLYTAARTDPVLRADLEPVVAAHLDHLVSLTAAVALGTGVDDRDGRFAALVDLAILAVQGLRLNQMVLPDHEQAARLRALLRELTEVVVPTK